MGTINTAEVAKKNPSVYIEMVQQKVDLDLAALENSRQLSLLYLETYARENNLSESEKIHLENVIDYKVFTEEAAVKKSLWERIKAAFKRLFDLLFGKGSPKIREEDMNKEVKCKFNVDDVNKQASGIEGLVRKLTGSQTKGDATSNAQELSNTVNKLKEFGSKTGWTIATLAAVDALKKTLGNILSSTTTAMNSFEKSYNAEMEKYNKEDLSNEEKEKRDELKDVNDSVINALKQLHAEITEIDKEVTRLSTLSAEGKLDEANKDDEGKEEKKDDGPDTTDLDRADEADGAAGGSSAGKSGDDFIDWINCYHYKYTQSEIDKGIVLRSISGDDKGYDEARKRIKEISNSSKKNIDMSDIQELYSKAKVSYNKYPIGILPGIRIDDKTKGNLIDAVGKITGEAIAEKIIIPGLYKSGSDWYHADNAMWKKLTNNKINTAIAGYVNATDKGDYIRDHIDPHEEKNKMVYPDGLTKEESEYAKKVVSNMKSAQNINYSKWTNADVGTSIKNAIKKTLGISGKPDPVYYRL